MVACLMVTANEPLPSSGNVLPPIWASSRPAHFGERNIDRHRDVDAAVVGLRHQIERLRERAIRLGLGRHDAGIGLHAEQAASPRCRRSSAARRWRGSGALRARGSACPAPRCRAEWRGTVLTHSPRAAFSMNGSLRSRVSKAPVWLRTALSRNGFTWLATLSFRPAIGKMTSTTLTCADRLGASRQFGEMVGFDVVVTVPWMSAC